MLITAFMATARKNPQWQWAADSLVHNMNANPSVALEVIFVDKMLWPTSLGPIGHRREELADAVAGRFSYRHVPPKPSAWQGPWRKTKRDFYALTNARNTAITLARGEHVIEFDDCTVLGKDWLYWHHRAAQKKIVAAGGFVSWNTATVVNGEVTGGEQHPNQDSRGLDMKKGYGSWCWGLNVSYPLERLLEVNGFDELYDGQGGSEDCDLGVRVERTGCPIVFFPACEIHQILETHEAVCDIETWGKPQVRPQKERVLKHDGRGHFANEFLIQELFEDPTRTLARGTESNLRELRRHVLREGYGAYPTTFAVDKDWRDGQPLSEME